MDMIEARVLLYVYIYFLICMYYYVIIMVAPMLAT